MNRKKIKQIIAISLAFTSFNFANSSSIPVLAAMFAKDATLSPQENYNNYLYEILENTTECTPLVSLSNSFDDSIDTTSKDLSVLFKVQYSNSTHKTITNSISLNGNIGNIQLPNDTSIFNNFKLIINTPKKITELYIKSDNPAEEIKSYTNLLENKNYLIDEISLTPTSSFRIFIKYDGEETVYTQSFNTTSKVNSTIISNPSSAYVIEDNKLFYIIKWDENNNAGLINSSLQTKKVFFNNNFYEVYLKDANTNPYYSSYYSKIELTENDIDSSSKPEIYTCDNLFQTQSFVLPNDRSGFITNSVIPNDNFELKNNILHYSSNKQFIISNSFENKSNPGVNLTIDPTKLKITSSLEGVQGSSIPLSCTLSHNNQNFDITDIPLGSNIIRIVYIDENSNLYTQKISTTLDTSTCSVTAPNVNTSLNINNQDSNYSFQITDPYLNASNLKIEKLVPTVNSPTPKVSTFYYKIKNSSGADIALNPSDITISTDGKTLDFLSAIRKISDLPEGKYSIDYVYYNSVLSSSTPSSATALMEHLELTIDNTNPEVVFNYSNLPFKDDLKFTEENNVFTFSNELKVTIKENNVLNKSYQFYKVEKNAANQALILNSLNQVSIEDINMHTDDNFDYVLKVKVEDSSGNTNGDIKSDSYDSKNCIRFSVDKTRPIISSSFDNLIPHYNIYYIDGKQKIAVYFTDNNLNLLDTSYFIPNLDNVTGLKNRIFYSLIDPTYMDISNKLQVSAPEKSLTLNFDNNIDMLNGAYQLKVKASDNSGNISEASYNFVVDTMAPIINSQLLDPTTPEDKIKYFNDKTNNNINFNFIDNYISNILTFTKESSDMVNSKNKVFYKLTKDATDISTKVTSNINSLNLNLNDTSKFTEGTYKLEVQVSDWVGNISTKSYDFVIDKTAPEIKTTSFDTFTEINTKYYTNNTTNKNIAITFNDDNLDAILSFASDSSEMANSKNKVFYKLTKDATDVSTNVQPNINLLNLDLNDTSKFTEGTYKLEVQVSDRVGNIATKFYDFVIDKTVPEIITTSFDEFPINFNRYFIKNTTNKNIHIDLNDNNTISDLTFTSDLFNMEGSTNHVFYSLYRGAIDYTPNVIIDKYSNSLNLNLSDTSKILDGTYKLDIALFDFAGNKTIQTYDFVIDRDAPSIKSLFNQLAKQEGKYYLDGKTKVDFNFVDDNIQLPKPDCFIPNLDNITKYSNEPKDYKNKVYYKLTDDTNKDLTSNISLNATLPVDNPLSLDLANTVNMPDGTYKLRVVVYDILGNKSDEVYDFVIDRISPTIKTTSFGTLSTITNKYYINDTSNKNIHIELEDGNPISSLIFTPNLDNMEGSKNKVFYKVTNGTTDLSDNINISKNPNSLNLDLNDTSKFPEGPYKLDITLFDFAGNRTDQTYDFVIDTTSPTIESNLPSELFYFNTAATKNINIKFKDSNLSLLNPDDFISNLDNMYDSKNKVFYNLTKDDEVHNTLVTLNKSNNTLMLDLSNVTKFPEGTYKFDISVFDNAGNRSDKHYTFVIDRTSPVVESTMNSHKNTITVNNKSFFVYRSGLIIKASKYSSDLAIDEPNFDGLLLQPSNGGSGVKDFNVEINKLSSYNADDGTSSNTLTPKDATCVISDPGFYEIKSTYTDLANNTSEQKTEYVAIDNENPTVNFLYFDENGDSVNPVNGSYFSKSLTTYIEVNDINSSDVNYPSKINFNLTSSYYINNIHKIDTYNTENLVPVSSLPNTDNKVSHLPNGSNMYGKYYYCLGKVEGDNLIKTVLKDVKIDSTCTIKDSDNYEAEFSYPKKHFDIEVTAPKLGVKINGTDTTESSLVFINDLTNPKFDIQVTGGIAGAKNTQFIINNDAVDISDKFELSDPKSDGNISNYTLTYKGDLKDLKDLNGYYNFTFIYTSNTDIQQTIKRNFVLDTKSPSYVISFNNSNSPLIDMNKQVIDEKLTIDTPNSDKLSALQTKKVYSSYKDLYVTIDLLDNSFNNDDPYFKDLKETILSNLTVTLDDIVINTTNKGIQLGKEYFINDKIYKLKVSSSDKSSNTTSRELDIIVDRNAPTINFGFVEENNKDITGNKVIDTYYFNKNVKPYIHVSDTICNTSELKYSVTINSTLYDKGYTIYNLNEKEFKSTLAALGPGAYTIIANVTDFAGNSSTESINLVVDSTNPITKLNTLRKNSLVNLSHYVNGENSSYNYIDEENKLYVIVKDEPYLDVEKFRNSIKLTGSNVVCENNNLLKIDNLSVTEFTKNEVTEFMKGKVLDSDNTTRIFEISNNNKIFTNGYYKLNYVLTDYSGNTSGAKEAQFTIDNTSIDANNTFNPNNIYFNSSYNFSIVVPKHYSGYKSSSIKLYKDNKLVTDRYVTDNLKLQMAGGTIDVSVPLSDNDKSSEGTYSFKVTLTDNTGKEYVTSSDFVMDRTIINLSQFNFNLGSGQYKDGIYYTNSENIDMNFVLDPDLTGEASRTVTINGTPIPSNDNKISNGYFVNDGEYNIIVCLKDRAGNISSYERKVIVDRTAATISLDGFDGVIDNDDNTLYINKIITPKITVDDRFGEDLPRRTAYLNNSVYTNSEISGNGKHTYSVKAIDLAGNESTKDITFVLDTVRPDISISDVIDGKYYNKDVKPTYSTPDTTATLSAYLNDTPYDGSIITGDGNYALKLICTDKAKNVTEIVYNFVIDTVAPSISVSGLNENEINGIITPSIKLDDPLSTILAVLNGEYYYGGAISESGKYTLMIKAMDKAGNISEKIISFIIDADVPQIYISNLENGRLYVDEIEPHISVTKNAKISMTLNGNGYDGKNITTPGEYELIVTAVDSLSNKSTEVYRFTLAAKGSPEAEGIVNGNDDSNKGTTFIDKVKAVAPTTGILLGLSSIGSMLFMGIKKRIK